jgi:hypothetical protein
MQDDRLVSVSRRPLAQGTMTSVTEKDQDRLNLLFCRRAIGNLALVGDKIAAAG